MVRLPRRERMGDMAESLSFEVRGNELHVISNFSFKISDSSNVKSLPVGWHVHSDIYNYFLGACLPAVGRGFGDFE
jgi:hypothetical protein